MRILQVHSCDWWRDWKCHIYVPLVCYLGYVLFHHMTLIKVVQLR